MGKGGTNSNIDISLVCFCFAVGDMTKSLTHIFKNDTLVLLIN